ncbi:MAG: PQQ-binding-like beta-propeller repeat protein [Candidatus Hydrogenedentes bacterium]|nr:PQQ-binding-like beta-propeller repeat protein [Candidatus Hydrogenedentota bacterium]
MNILLKAVLCVGLAMGTAWTDAPGNWPQFRGPGARGVSEGQALPHQWSAEPTSRNIEWQREIPGRAWSSPIVWGERVFLTTAIAQGEVEAPKKGLYFGGERPDAPDLTHEWKVLCLDIQSGGVLWERTVHEGKPPMPRHLKNSYASETPVTDGERVYAYFGNLGLWCLDMDGNEVWSQKMEPRKLRFGWGTAASPVLHEDRLYILNDNEEDSYLQALDKLTGKEIWRVQRDERSNWSTPYVWVNEHRVEIVTAGSDQVRSYGLDGELLWTLQGMSSITIATPYAADGLLYLSSGYVGDKQRRCMPSNLGQRATYRCRKMRTPTSGLRGPGRRRRRTIRRLWCMAIGCMCLPTAGRYRASKLKMAPSSMSWSGFPMGEDLPARRGPTTAKSSASMKTV